MEARLGEIEKRLDDLDEIKQDFGDRLQAKLATMEAEAGATTADLRQIVNEAKSKFDGIEAGLQSLYADAKVKFDELEALIKSGNAMGGNAGTKKLNFLPDKMMIPKVFEGDINSWKRWKEEVTKFFDEEHEGMKAVMDEVAKNCGPITEEVLQQAFRNNPAAVGDKLQKWKHLYRALEKLTSGEAARVISTVRAENGFEAWRQLHLRFEPELEAQKNTVLYDLHSIEAARTIEDTKLKLVELKVRIARAEDVLDEPLHSIQKKTAMLHILDPISKQHMANTKYDDFNDFYTAIMNFANNASTGGGESRMANKVESVKKDEETGSEEDGGWLNGLARAGQCHVCGQSGHWARECPNNGKGSSKGEEKGKGYKGKGKGKGKGPVGGCFECGGDHYKAQCPYMSQYGPVSPGKGGKKGFGKGGKGYKGSGKGKGWVNTVVEPWEYGGEQHVEWGAGQGGWLCNIKEAIPAPRENLEMVRNKTSMAKNKACSCQRMISNQFYLLMEDDEKFASDDSDEKVVGDNSNDEVKDVKHRPNRWTKRKNHGKKTMGGLQIVRTIEPESLNICTEDGNWELLEAAVDSGATEHVMPDQLLTSIPTVPSTASRRGVEYEVANGQRVPNEGEKRFNAITDDGVDKKVVMQVCDVNQGLLSVSKMTAAGNRVVFDEEGSYIEDRNSGKITWMEKRNGMFTLKLWVPKPGSNRPF